MNSETQSGKVKWFSAEKGYGFITPDGGHPDVFCHQNQVFDKKALSEGDFVEFQTEMSAKGPRANFVRVLTSTAGLEWTPHRVE